MVRKYKFHRFRHSYAFIVLFALQAKFNTGLLNPTRCNDSNKIGIQRNDVSRDKT